MSTLAALEHRVRQLWRPPPRLNLSDWADAKFSLPAGDANAGRWHTLPYQKGVMDAVSDPTIERVTWMKSKRVGYTTGCICCALGYYIEHDPANILLVQPTIDDAKKFSKEQITPLLTIPVLSGLVAPEKSRSSDNTLLLKVYRGGMFALVGANSPRGFRRASYRVVLFDEIDGYDRRGAGKEGDQIALGIGRTEYYWNRKIIIGSTPTVTGASRIEEIFLDGDQRRYYVPCPSCGEFQVLRFENLRWPKGRPHDAHFICVKNGCLIEHQSKRDMVEAGEWRAEAPDNFTEHNRHASFHIWAAYSYSPNATWGEIAGTFVKAARNPLEHRTFKNQWLGETWREAVVSMDWETLYRRRDTYPIGQCPKGVLFLTAGVDVQKDRLVYEVVGYGRDKTSWSIDAGVLAGDTADLVKGPWPQLDALLARSFPHESGVVMTISRLAVDSGFNTQQVCAWGRRYTISRVITVKGYSGISSLGLGVPRRMEISARGKPIKTDRKIWPVYGHVFKDELFGFLRMERPLDVTADDPPGFVHFPQYDEEYFRQLTAEELRPSRDGRRYEYVQLAGRANDFLDARVYARAAASAQQMDRFSDSDWLALELASGQERTPEPSSESPETPPPPTAASAAPRRTPWLAPRGRGWLRR
jgi:terminase, large subunit